MLLGWNGTIHLNHRSLKTRYLGWLFGFIFLACCSHANAACLQTDSPASEPAANVQISPKAKELGFDVKKLGSIDRKISSLVEQGKVFGCSALIYRKGEEIYFGKWGNQNQRKQIPIERDTIFRIYSMSKPVTSVAAMQLVERGKLDLNAPVSDYLPEFKDLKVLESRNGVANEVDPKRTMKVLDLLRHTSGLSYGFFGRTAVDKQYLKNGILLTDLNLKSTVGKLGEIPLLHHPGTQFHYSASTDVLGRVIEVASEKTFDDYLKTDLFGPLAMEDTFFNVPESKQQRLSQLFRPNSKGDLVVANPLQSVRFLTPENEFFPAVEACVRRLMTT